MRILARDLPDGNALYLRPEGRSFTASLIKSSNTSEQTITGIDLKLPDADATAATAEVTKR